jgi:hypothetical protein
MDYPKLQPMDSLDLASTLKTRQEYEPKAKATRKPMPDTTNSW